MASYQKYPVKSNAKGYKWMYFVDLGKDPKTGKRIQKCKRGFDTKKEAEAHCAELLNKVNNGDLGVTPSKMLMKDFMDKWLNTRKNLRPNTLRGYRSKVNHIKHGLGYAELSKLTDDDLYTFYEHLKEEKGLGNTSINDIHKIIKSALKYAVNKKWVSENIAEHVEVAGRDKKQIRIWSVEESNQFLSAVKDHREYIAFLLALTTGMRQSEILGLPWKNVNFESKKIYVDQTLTHGTRNIENRVKAKNSQRSISIDAFTMEELHRQKKLITKERFVLGEAYTDLDLVIPTSKGTPIIARNLLRTFYRYVEKAGVRKINFHDLRHTHASTLLKIGENPKAVAERLGHDVRTLMETYAHVLPDMQETMANNFGSTFYQNNPLRKKQTK